MDTVWFNKPIKIASVTQLHEKYAGFGWKVSSSRSRWHTAEPQTAKTMHKMSLSALLWPICMNQTFPAWCLRERGTKTDPGNVSAFGIQCWFNCRKKWIFVDTTATRQQLQSGVLTHGCYTGRCETSPVTFLTWLRNACLPKKQNKKTLKNTTNLPSSFCSYLNSKHKSWETMLL